MTASGPDAADAVAALEALADEGFGDGVDGAARRSDAQASRHRGGRDFSHQ